MPLVERVDAFTDKTTGKPDDFPEFGQRRNSGSAGAHPLLRAGTPAQERSPDLLAVLGSSLSFVNAGLDALGATLATTIKFLLTLDFLMGHDSTPQSEKRNL